MTAGLPWPARPSAVPYSPGPGISSNSHASTASAATRSSRSSRSFPEVTALRGSVSKAKTPAPRPGPPLQRQPRRWDTMGMTVDEELSALMDRFFTAVSFGPGGRPAYERLHDLFTPAGRLINAIGDAPEDTTVAGFIEPRRALVDGGV